jgi:hypothetical protein
MTTIDMVRIGAPPDPQAWTITETHPVKRKRRYSPSPFAGYGGRRKR